MSDTSSIVSIATAWAGTAGGGLVMIKKYVAKAEKYISNAEKQVDEIISTLDDLNTKLSSLIPAPTPAPAKAKAVKKTAEPKKRLR
jgi:hypothetical protein